MRIPFGEWLPDQASLGNPGVITATNVFPFASGYLPVPALQTVTDALDARPRGAIQARDKDLNVKQYAGDAAKLYENLDNVWTDRSKADGYSTASEECWEFVAWKNKVLAVNFSDHPQQLAFGGTTFSDLTTDFKARHITTIKDFVVAANTSDTTDGNVPSRVRWSAFNDETDWTVSASTLSDFQDLQTAPVLRIFGGEFGVILQSASVWRMTFVGAPVVFQFDNVVPGIGTIASGAAAQDGDSVFFLSAKGFYELVNGTEARPIGVNKVDEFILNDLNQNFLFRISAVADPASNRVFWAYPGADSVNGRPNRIVVYDRSLQRWALIEDEVELLWQAAGTGFTLEGLDNISSSLDALTPSLDSSAWIGGAEGLGVFDDTFKSGFLTGDAMTATIESREAEFNPGGRTQLNAFRPHIEGGTTTAQVGTRNRLSDSVTFGSSLSESSTGRFETRSQAVFHRFKVTISGAWTAALGVIVDRKDIRRAGGRG